MIAANAAVKLQLRGRVGVSEYMSYRVQPFRCNYV